jgi:uncharacterized membrane protein YhaH (DUF805 family)
MSSIMQGLKGLLNFKDRTNRKDFWIYIIFVFVVLIILSLFQLYNFQKYSFITIRSSNIFNTIFFIILSAAAITRRLRDIGWTGFLTFLVLIFPILIIIIGVIPSKNQR